MNLSFNYPTPSNITYMWRFGSMLGLVLGIQLISGILLRTFYLRGWDMAFSSVVFIENETWGGHIIRLAHSMGASFIFLFVYIHLFRGLINSRPRNKILWSSGVLILLVLMALRFLGYILPIGQMSFWGATVITNLFRVIPFVGQTLTTLIWGDFSVGPSTLSRFYSFHFLLPFVLRALAARHVVLLHQKGSRNPLGLKTQKVGFGRFFYGKDIVGFVFFLFIFFGLFFTPLVFFERDNFIVANSLVTPSHIQPEWYFLLSYTVLRSVPNKLGGVIALAFRVVALIFLVFGSYFWIKRPLHIWLIRFFFWVCLILFWLGAKPVEAPFILLGKLFRVLYFTIIFLLRYL